MISEETLTLYYYDDGLSGDERRLVEMALNEDTLLSARYTDLRRQLDRWAETDELTAPAHMKERWHDSIDRAARAEQGQDEEHGRRGAIATVTVHSAPQAGYDGAGCSAENARPAGPHSMRRNGEGG